MRTLRNLLFLVLLLLCQSAWAAKGTLLFVPLDNRPVCFDYTVQTMEAAGWEVKTPPREFIASEKSQGEPEKMLDWLEQNATDAIGIVASSDALIYGGGQPYSRNTLGGTARASPKIAGFSQQLWRTKACLSICHDYAFAKGQQCAGGASLL